jgi:pimeloyl-ACP methyl ester carboxylesterase
MQAGYARPVLLLLHGLGATGGVWQGWRPLLARRWPGHWLAPDLPGHGESPPLAMMPFEELSRSELRVLRYLPTNLPRVGLLGVTEGDVCRTFPLPLRLRLNAVGTLRRRQNWTICAHPGRADASKANHQNPVMTSPPPGGDP